MNIVLEGSDATFKTTVAEKLANRLATKVVKGSSFEMSQCSQPELFEKFKEIHTKNDGVIIDRSIYSNQVYATIFNKTKLSDEERNIIESMIKHETLIVYLYASEKVITERINSRGDKDIGINDIATILEHYEQAMQLATQNGMNVLSFDTSAIYDSDAIANTIVNVLLMQW